MTEKSRKRKICEKNRSFQEKWTTGYHFVNVGELPTCLICGEKIRTVKEYNVKRHFETTHQQGEYGKFSGEKGRKNKEVEVFFVGPERYVS